MPEIKITCRKCGNNLMASREKRIPEIVHSLECNWCPECEKEASSYYEEYWMKEDGKEYYEHENQ